MLTTNMIDRHRGRIAHLAELERLLVEVEDVSQQGVVRARGGRAATGQDVGGREHLQAEAEADDQVIEDDRRHQRERDVAERLPAAGAIDPCRLIQLHRDAAEPGEEHERELTRSKLGDQDEGYLRERRIAEPVRGRQPER